MAAASTPRRNTGWRPQRCRRELHWFKWEAYTTLALRLPPARASSTTCSAELALIDPARRRSTQPRGDRHRARLPGRRLAGLRRAVPLGRSATTTRVLGGWSFASSARSPPGRSATSSRGRGAYMHFGAMLGTIMVLNVFFVIIPGQRELVQAKQRGPHARPDARAARQAALGAQHLFHAAGAVHHDQQPLRGPLRRTSGTGCCWSRSRPRRPGRGSGSSRGIAAPLRPCCWSRPRCLSPPRLTACSARDLIDRGAMARAQAIVAERCAPCHSASPRFAGIAAAPKGVVLDDPAQLAIHAARVRQQVATPRDASGQRDRA